MAAEIELVNQARIGWARPAGDAVEVAVPAQDHTSVGIASVVAPREVVQRPATAIRIDLVNGAGIIGAATIGSSIKIARPVLDDSSLRAVSFASLNKAV